GLFTGFLLPAIRDQCRANSHREHRCLRQARFLSHPLGNHLASFFVNANHGVPIRLAKLARFFQNSAHMKTTTLPLRNLMNRSPLRRRLLLIPLVLVCFALSPTARAVDPPPDGGYPNNNIAEGEDALFSLDTLLGTDNTAVGFDALYNNTTGRFNTASGSKALEFNTIGF